MGIAEILPLISNKRSGFEEHRRTDDRDARRREPDRTVQDAALLSAKLSSMAR
jgi:hypothetical protein